MRSGSERSSIAAVFPTAPVASRQDAARLDTHPGRPLDSAGPAPVNEGGVSHGRRPRPDGRTFASFDLPAPVMDGHPRRRLHALHADPGEGAAAVARGPGRRRAGADRHRQDGGVPDHDLHAPARATSAPGARPAPRALVIAPTRELVVQIAEDARLLGQATGLAHPRRVRRRRLQEAARPASRPASTCWSARPAG